MPGSPDPEWAWMFEHPYPNADFDGGNAKTIRFRAGRHALAATRTDRAAQYWRRRVTGMLDGRSSIWPSTAGGRAVFFAADLERTG